MAKPNRTLLAILGFLTWRPMSGYDVKKSVDSSIRNFWNESYGQIYPMLRRLSDEGLATPRGAAGAGGRRRRAYAITAAGREALVRWLREPDPPSNVRIEVLLKLFFGRQVDPDCNLRRVETYREAQRSEVERYRHLAEQLREGASGQPDLPYWLMTLRYGELQSLALIDWCDETLNALRESESGRAGGTR
jgi:DNA-binding PadR family transcriptional regulator